MSEPLPITDAELSGLRVAMFEFVWSTFPWIHQIAAEAINGRLHLIVTEERTISQDEREACRRILLDILNELQKIRKKGTLCADVSFIPKSQQSPSALALISDDIFQSLAKTIAPWRLDAGR
jgi:hypothetical protein